MRFANDILAASAEFFGTFMFLFLGLGGIQGSAISAAASGETAFPSPSQILYIAASMSMSLLAAVWVFFRISGGNFNPQVSLALLLCGILSPVRFILYVTAQITGAIAASYALSAMLPGSLQVTPSLGKGTSISQGLFIEMFLTAGLCLTVLMLAVEKQRATPFAPISIGVCLFAIHLVGVIFTGAGVNSARSLAPAIISGFDGSHWIYHIGPSLGSVLAAAIYIFFKAIDYKSLNPGQDSIDEAFTPTIPPARWLRRILIGDEKTDSLPMANSLPYTTSISPTTPTKKNFEEISVTID